jgi:hypothetical protein
MATRYRKTELLGSDGSEESLSLSDYHAIARFVVRGESDFASIPVLEFERSPAYDHHFR